MSVYASKLQNTTRFVRADSIAQAVHIIRAIDGFCLRETLRKVGENFSAVVGSPFAYDQAAAKLEGMNHASLKKQRIASRAKTASGKGARLPSGLVIHNY